MTLKEKWENWKNAKYMWDMARVNVMIDSNDNSWILTKDYEYLAKQYKGLYFQTLILMFGFLIFAIFMLW